MSMFRPTPCKCFVAPRLDGRGGPLGASAHGDVDLLLYRIENKDKLHELRLRYYGGDEQAPPWPEPADTSFQGFGPAGGPPRKDLNATKLAYAP